MNRKTIGILAVICAAIIGAVSVGAIAEQGSDTSHGPKPPVESTDTGLSASLDVFATPRQDGDALPSEQAAALVRAGTDGINPALSRKVLTQGETTAYLIPSADGVCTSIVRPEATYGGCREAWMVERNEGGPATFWVDANSGKAALYSVVPNGVESVALESAKGSSTAVPVSANFYYTEVSADEEPTAVTFTTENGAAVRQPVMLPPSIDAIERTEAAIE